MALRMNEHNNGYMRMDRYAVWTPEVNTNDKPDLNEAFFTKRERAPDDRSSDPGGASWAPTGGRTASRAFATASSPIRTRWTR
jgi:hypothetical protein